MRARWAAVGAAVAVSMGGGVVMVANAGIWTPSAEVGFKSITPCRLLDTRTTSTTQIIPLGIRHGKVTTTANDLTVIFDRNARNTDLNADDFTYEWATDEFRPIMGECNDAFDADDSGTGISETDIVTALVLNVTVVDFTDSTQSFLTVYPWQLVSGSSPRPFFSNLNPLSSVGVTTNQVTVALRELDGNGDTAGLGTVKLSGVYCDNGTAHGDSNCAGLNGFRVYNNAGKVNVILDVTGYYYAE